MEKVSIIVPMYNNEKSISKLINSLTKQTYKNLEILLINDGSTDDTVKICKSYASDTRIKIISQKNNVELVMSGHYIDVYSKL